MKTLTLVLCLIALSASFASAQHHPKRSEAKITPQQAESTAIKRYPGKVVGKVALENEDGHWQYSVNIRSGKKLREVMVDAHSGKIASVELTTPQEEAREAAAEKKAKHKG